MSGQDLGATLVAVTVIAAAIAAGVPARAAEIGGIQGRYGKTQDLGSTKTAALSILIEPDTPPRWLTFLGDDIHFDATLGVFKDGQRDDNDVFFTHFGPVWHYEPGLLGRRGFVEIGTAPTLLSEDELDGEDIGGRFHMTSHVMLGFELDRRERWRAGLRLQHTSNAGLQDDNPGIDALLFELRYRFSGP